MHGGGGACQGVQFTHKIKGILRLLILVGGTIWTSWFPSKSGVDNVLIHVNTLTGEQPGLVHVTHRRRSCGSYSGVWCSVYVCARVWDLSYGPCRTRVVGFEQMTEAVCSDSHVGFFWGTQRRKGEGAWPVHQWMFTDIFERGLLDTLASQVCIPPSCSSAVVYKIKLHYLPILNTQI